ncbi:hypothetical protein D3C76_1775110 [compost metagenome]
MLSHPATLPDTTAGAVVTAVWHADYPATHAQRLTLSLGTRDEHWKPAGLIDLAAMDSVSWRGGNA